MNEHIKRLAKQAGFDAERMEINHANGNPSMAEQFAELIVKECAGKVDWILAEGGKTQGDLIREHFGVEE